MNTICRARAVFGVIPLLTHWFGCQPPTHSYQTAPRGAAVAVAVVDKAAVIHAAAIEVVASILIMMFSPI